MWLKTNVLAALTRLVNLNKVHRIEIYETRAHSFWVRAYLDDGGCREEYDTPFNMIRLYAGKLQECEDYVDWLAAEMDARNDVVEYSKPVAEGGN